MPDSIEDIINLVRQGQGGGGTEAPSDSSVPSHVPQILGGMGVGAPINFGKPQQTSGPQVIKPLKYNVSPFAVYDRLSDGSYIAKYPNYVGAEGNEDRLAKQQSTGEQWYNGLIKFKNKTMNYALDATVGTVVGIYEGLTAGDFRHVWDNSFSNWMDDTNKRLENRLPNFYTDEQKAMGVLESVTTANFWANDFMGGLAFVTGALVPELVLGAVSGGATLPAGMAKFGFKTAAKSTMKSTMKNIGKAGVKNLDDAARMGIVETGTNSVRALHRANLGSSIGGKLNTARFLVQTSNFEAGMEARHNFHEAMDEYFNNFREVNGRSPSFEEIQEFTDSAVTAANYVYTANMAILSVSNAAMFGAKFNVGISPGKWLTNQGNKLIGLGYRRTGVKAGQVAMQEATRLQKIGGRVYKFLEKPAVEGLYEEGLQGVAGTTMQNYLKAKYDPDVEEGYDLWASFTDALHHQYTSKEGWKEMAIGMLIGFGAPMLQGQAPGGIGKNSYRSRRKQIEAQIKDVNESQTELGRNILARVTQGTGIANYSAQTKSKADNFESTYMDNSLINAQYIKIQEQVKSRSEVIKDYDATVDQMKLTDDQMRDIGGVEGLDAYKQSLKDEFRRDMDNYEFAKKTVNSLGLNKKIKDAKGNIFEIEDAVLMTIMTGKTALDSARNIGQQIDNLLQTEGAFSHLEHYNSLTKQQKAKVNKRRELERKLRNLTEQATKYSNELAGVQTDLKANYSEDVKRRRQQKATEKSVATQLEIQKVQEEIATIDSALENDLITENYNIDQLTSTDINTHNIQEMVEQLDVIEDFAKSLKKSGRTKDAEVLGGLIKEFKMNSDAHREMNNMVRKMYDTNFFGTKAGRGFLKMVSGKEYKMSDEFRQIIRDNDAVIDASMKAAGIRTDRTVEDVLEDMFGEENENFSDREKYRLESIIRLQLGYDAIRERIKQASAETEILESTEATTRDPLAGDTVTLKRTLNPGKQDLGNIAVLDKLINQIIQELDQFRLGRVNQPEINRLEAELEQLKARREKLDSKVAKETVETLKKDLETEKKVGTPERVQELEEQIQELEAQYELGLDEEISNKEKELAEVRERKSIRIMGSPEYRRINELNKKKASKGLTEEEQVELSELEEDLDQWMTITGIVAEGMRLSDLIEQRHVLQHTKIAEYEQVDMSSPDDVVGSVHIPDKTGTVYYNLSQTYDSVTATMNSKEGKIEISGITWDAFMQEAGIPAEAVELDKQGKKPIGGMITMDKQGNLLLTPEDVEAINKQGNISILPTSRGLTTNYSVVLKHTKNEDGSTMTTVLKSNFNQDFKENRSKGRAKAAYKLSPMNPNAVYDMQNGDEVTLEVSAADEYNQELLKKYKSAKNSKAKDKDKKLEKATKALQDGLVIRIVSKSGKFVGVLKGKREGGVKNEKLATKFEGLRNTIVNDVDFMDSLINIGRKQKVRVPGTVTVSNVLIGFPSFNFNKTADGIAIENKPFTDPDIEKVVDIGYIQDEKQNSQSGRKDAKTNFLKKSMERAEKGTKIPYVVVQKGNTRIALPVTIAPNRKQGLEEFEAIWKADTPQMDKAIALNKFMASRGIDISKLGNSFIGVGEHHNLTEKFYAEKLADLEDIEYFRDLESWANPTRDKTALLKDGVTINIDVHNPVHSPKVSLDFSKLEIDETNVSTPNPTPTNNKTSNNRKSAFDQAIEEAEKKEC